ncbi:MAG: bifunctional 4-hydroxy-2-oxoglutarate aldolase/2-dehydro-3-deoxy-phosphogluconate aldolase [Pseudomonas sp.]
MRLAENSSRLSSIFDQQRVLPVLSIQRETDILPLADALAAGGITNLEVTLRTPLGLGAIRVLAEQRPDICVGAGTVLDGRQFQSVLDAGARFIVSPGCTDELLALGLDSPVPLLPGVTTASEIMQGYRLGYRCFKLFPAEICGGVALLKALAGPFHDVRFCPTGGITPQKMPDYLAMENVVAVGGSWMVPPQLVQAGDWDAITRLCQQFVPKDK